MEGGLGGSLGVINGGLNGSRCCGGMTRREKRAVYMSRGDKAPSGELASLMSGTKQ